MKQNFVYTFEEVYVLKRLLEKEIFIAQISLFLKSSLVEVVSTLIFNVLYSEATTKKLEACRAIVVCEEELPSCLNFFLAYQMSQTVVAKSWLSFLLDSKMMEYRVFLKSESLFAPRLIDLQAKLGLRGYGV
ncbi:hypothetical protein M9H77_21051 [Catharanthus roseus]|uniref:Uncharacterized protein n=1 Tax=Catharanthus roseus TaxID=4058 RepID=A0ACC0AP56_CATRO|nr:hypothetical protein M9H77_21051 [Catharanthus roseus]